MVGDSDRLAQVLRNLLSNAPRHTPAGGEVAVVVRGQGDRVQLVVRDTGSGISPADLPHVFDRFYRGDRSRSRQGGGAGLGLAIARQLVRAHARRAHGGKQPRNGNDLHHDAALACRERVGVTSGEACNFSVPNTSNVCRYPRVSPKYDQEKPSMPLYEFQCTDCSDEFEGIGVFPGCRSRRQVPPECGSAQFVARCPSSPHVEQRDRRASSFIVAPGGT